MDTDLGQMVAACCREVDMDDSEAAPTLVACCGLYCGQCRSYRKGRCPGCARNERASWCKVRNCCLDYGYDSCADCIRHHDPRECDLFHNPMSRIVSFVLDSDRRACIFELRARGRASYAQFMAQRRLRTLPRRRLVD